MVPFSARLAHGYPQGELLKYIHFANNYMLTFRFCALSLLDIRCYHDLVVISSPQCELMPITDIN